MCGIKIDWFWLVLKRSNDQESRSSNGWQSNKILTFISLIEILIMVMHPLEDTTS